MDMNILLLQGNLAADPEIKIYKKGDIESTLARICIVNQCQKVTEDFHPEPLYMYATAFGSVANYIKKAFKKGSRILIQGEIRPNVYEKDGKKIYNQQLIIRHAYFDGLNKRSKNMNSEASADMPDSDVETYTPIPSEADAFMSISPSDLDGLPFADI